MNYRKMFFILMPLFLISVLAITFFLLDLDRTNLTKGNVVYNLFKSNDDKLQLNGNKLHGTPGTAAIKMEDPKTQRPENAKQNYGMSNVVKEQVLFAAKNGWSKWLEAVEKQQFNFNRFTQQQRDEIFSTAAARLQVGEVETLIHLGFDVPPRAYFDIIIGGEDLAYNEQEILAKYKLFEQTQDLQGSSRVYGRNKISSTTFDRAISFGYIDMAKYLEKNGSTSSDPNNIYINLLRGRQPTIDAIIYLEKIGFEIPGDIKEIAEKLSIDEKNPELYKFIVRNY